MPKTPFPENGRLLGTLWPSRQTYKLLRIVVRVKTGRFLTCLATYELMRTKDQVMVDEKTEESFSMLMALLRFPTQ
jgi:hypothetical protein